MVRYGSSWWLVYSPNLLVNLTLRQCAYHLRLAMFAENLRLRLPSGIVLTSECERIGTDSKCTYVFLLGFVTLPKLLPQSD